MADSHAASAGGGTAWKETRGNAAAEVTAWGQKAELQDVTLGTARPRAACCTLLVSCLPASAGNPETHPRTPARARALTRRLTFADSPADSPADFFSNPNVEDAWCGRVHPADLGSWAGDSDTAARPGPAASPAAPAGGLQNPVFSRRCGEGLASVLRARSGCGAETRICGKGTGRMTEGGSAHRARAWEGF